MEREAKKQEKLEKACAVLGDLRETAGDFATRLAQGPVAGWAIGEMAQIEGQNQFTSSISFEIYVVNCFNDPPSAPFVSSSAVESTFIAVQVRCPSDRFHTLSTSLHHCRCRELLEFGAIAVGLSSVIYFARSHGEESPAPSKKSEKSSGGESGEKKSSSTTTTLKEGRRLGKEIARSARKSPITLHSSSSSSCLGLGLAHSGLGLACVRLISTRCFYCLWARRLAKCSSICPVPFLIMFCASQVRSAGLNHQYKARDTIPLYANKASPFHNPSKTYAYNDLPYCSPVEKESEVACKKKLTKEEVSQFRAALACDYYFQMYCDDLPIWAFIGKITLRTDTNSVVDLTEDEEVDVEFTYTVRWKETDNLFEKRIDKYLWSSTLLHYRRVHWFAVMNSCLTVLIVLGCLLTFYVRVLEKDINKCASDKELFDNQEERGWKSIHGDVFRYPKHESLFAAAIGSGNQLFVLVNAALPLGTILLLLSIWLFGASPLLLFGGIARRNSGSDLQAQSTKCPRGIPTLHWYRGTLPHMAVAGILPFGVIYVETYYLLASIWGHLIYTIYGILLIVFIILIIITVFVTVALTYFQLTAEDHEWWWSDQVTMWTIPELAFFRTDGGYNGVLGEVFEVKGSSPIFHSSRLDCDSCRLILGSTGLFIYGYCLYYYSRRSDMSGFLQTSSSSVTWVAFAMAFS
ncbi:hypothetical protein RHMOL_Rhmol09G0117700 [Rhododendron molle]|uniref:Uncharacterized protein n=1 Tax=Rhododendron molle TaxID=49168 RepID=A0ACC0MCD1_RHOML|nr:hypothetical protein RHMOL_Rhmol09G0117700 [Rhododendron molle]